MVLAGLAAVPIYYIFKWAIGNYPGKATVILAILFAMNCVTIKLKK